MKVINIRTIRIEDAEDFLNLGHTLDSETQLMMLEPGERQLTVEQQRARIQHFLESDNSTMLVAEHEGALVGFLAARGGEWRRNRHTAYVVIGVLQAYVGKGIGTRLFEAIDEWARGQGIHRLELTVMTHNERAVALYKKMGFTIEGTKRDSLFVNGAYVDEYYMAQLL